ncbi:MAG: dihydrofolate reductase [Akkermansiaceae bacterium]|nr:dihydrofolate reductase [Akkermansiaceae bacterium]
MKLSAIVAMTPDRVIGANGDLPWHLPDDLKFFKKQTLGHPIVMGRKTFESIGRPLPKRQNIILTHNPAYHADGAETIHHPKELREFQLIDQQAFIIGGAEIYKFFMPILDDIYITHINEEYPGDTYFPEYEDHFPKSELIWEQENFTIRRHHK